MKLLNRHEIKVISIEWTAFELGAQLDVVVVVEGERGVVEGELHWAAGELINENELLKFVFQLT